jgi:hypothetical protein
VRRLRLALIALLLVVVSAIGGAAPASAVTCGSNDQVYADNQGVWVSGVLAWGSNYGGAYRITLADYVRDGRYGVVYVQFYKHNIGWVDRISYSVADGFQRTISATFAKGYRVDMVAFGVGRSGEFAHTLEWDRNSYCGA